MFCVFFLCRKDSTSFAAKKFFLTVSMVCLLQLFSFAIVLSVFVFLLFDSSSVSMILARRMSLALCISCVVYFSSCWRFSFVSFIVFMLCYTLYIVCIVLFEFCQVLNVRQY